MSTVARNRRDPPRWDRPRDRSWDRPVRIRAGLSALALVAAWAGAAAAGTASLRVLTAEPGRPVWIAGRFAGLAPVRVDSLPPGELDVWIGDSLSVRAWARPWRVVLALTAGKEDTLRLGRLRHLDLRSAGPLRVHLDGRDLGWCPLTLLVPEDTPITIEGEGRGGSGPSRVRLAEGSSDTTLQLTPSMAVGEEGLLRASRRSPWLQRAGIYLPMAAVLAGTAGALTKKSADRAYDEYRSTADPDRMRERLDRCRVLDRAATGCWIAAEACLTLAAVSWLRSGGGAAPLRVEAGPDRSVRLALDLAFLRAPARSGPPTDTSPRAETRGGRRP